MQISHQPLLSVSLTPSLFPSEDLRFVTGPLPHPSYKTRRQEDFAVGWIVEDSSSVDTGNPCSSLDGCLLSELVL